MKYQPVNCGFYDYFEAAITLRKKVRMKVVDKLGNESHFEAKPVDILQKNGEEFLILDDAQKIRLDYILSFDGVENPGTSCEI